MKFENFMNCTEFKSYHAVGFKIHIEYRRFCGYVVVDFSVPDHPVKSDRFRTLKEAKAYAESIAA